MNKCPNCGHENRAGEIVCTNCGTNLLTGERPSDTKKLDEKNKGDLTKEFGEDVLNTETTSASDVFPSNATLRLEIVGSPLPINVKFSKPALTLGRRDPATGALPDVDLAPFAGYRMGVSRRHSQIRRTEEGFLELFDLGSSNGTFLNGQRLNSHTPYRLNNYDRVALGQIVFQIVFRVPTDESMLEKTPETKAPSTKPKATDSGEMAQTKKMTGDELDKLKTSDEADKSDLLGNPTGKIPKEQGESTKQAVLEEPLEGKVTQRKIETIKSDDAEEKQPPATEQKAEDDENDEK